MNSSNVIDFAERRSRRMAGGQTSKQSDFVDRVMTEMVAEIQSERAARRQEQSSQTALGFDISDPKFIGFTVLQNKLARENGESLPRFRELARRWREHIGIE